MVALALVAVRSSGPTMQAPLSASRSRDGRVGVELARPALPLPPEQRVALRALGAAEAAPLRAGELRALRARSAFGHGGAPFPQSQHSSQSSQSSQSSAIPLHAPPQLDDQLALARAAAARLARLTHLEGAGYYYGSGFVPGVGVHYIDWRRVVMRFDPAHPAMLLVDATPGHVVRLAGFSYWVRSRTAPAGFAGTADQWHQHRGLCFIDGVLELENVDRSRCAGTWLNGGDLWMLHAWVVPGDANGAGVFAPRDRDLCPAHRVAETYWC